MPCGKIRRKGSDVVVPDNASLALTKFDRLPPPTSFKSADNKKIFNAIERHSPSVDYRNAYVRWRDRIEELPSVAFAATFEVDGRMVTGIGAGSVLANSLTMNRLWGMPLIPGSSLKGLASHYTASKLTAASGGTIDDIQLRDLFGDTEWSGCINWLDAWYDPEGRADSPFTLDVVTPHHGTYYRDPAHNPPWDFEDPKPSNFISVRGRFLVAVAAPDKLWAEAAMNILTRALAEWGIGAKTNAGYGRLLRCRNEYTSPWIAVAEEAQAAAAQAESDATQARAEAEAAGAEVVALEAELADTTRTVEHRAQEWVKVWSTIENDAERTRIGTLMLERLRSKPREFYRVTGRVLPEVAHREPRTPPGYMKPFLEEMKPWLDEHAPEVSQP